MHFFYGMHFYPGFTLTVVITCVGASSSTVNIICNSRNIIILFGKHRLQLLRKRSETICRPITLYQFHFQLHTNYKFRFHLKHTDFIQSILEQVYFISAYYGIQWQTNMIYVLTYNYFDDQCNCMISIKTLLLIVTTLQHNLHNIFSWHSTYLCPDISLNGKYN